MTLDPRTPRRRLDSTKHMPSETHNKRRKRRAAGPNSRGRKGIGRNSIGTVFGIPWIYLVIPALAIGCGICVIIFWLKDGFP